MIFIVAVLCIVAIVLAYFIFFKKKEQKGSAPDEVYFAPKGESQERIRKLGKDKPGEDASHLLDTSKLHFPRINVDYETAEFKPSPSVNYIIDIAPPESIVLKKDDLWKIFDKDWRQQNEMADVYGRSVPDGKWTYVIAGNSPEAYDAVQLSIKLQALFSEEKNSIDSLKLTQFIEELNQKLNQHPLQLQLRQTESLNDAIARAERIVNNVHRFSREMIIVLRSERLFDGRKAWDTLTNAGLEWGDSDLFHWSNDTGYGDEEFFSVWTSTSPGYFLPEVVKKGRFNPVNLVFGFSIPRSADPINIFEAMVDVVHYCQKKIGGIMLDENGKLFNVAEKRKWLSEIIVAMKDEGIVPGEEEALYMFQ